MMIWASLQRVEAFPVQQFVSEPGIEARDLAVSRHGLIGLEARQISHQLLRSMARTSLASNSGPITLRTKAGGPRRMKRSVRASITSVEFSFRFTLIVRQSRLNSSRMFNVCG